MIRGNIYTINQLRILIAILLSGCASNSMIASDTVSLRDTIFRSASVEDTIPTGIWDKIDLTGPKMKPSYKKSRWWLYALGAGTIGGGIYWYINREKDTVEIPDNYRFEVFNDTISTICGNNDTTIEPLLNDIGDGLYIADISSHEAVTLQGNTIIIDKYINSTINISVRVRDKRGTEKISILHIIVQFTPFTPDDKSHRIKYNEEVTDNIFGTSPCNECNILNVTGDHHTGRFTMDDSGEYQYIPNEEFRGIATFFVEVENNCNLKAVLKIEIIVSGKDCLIDPKFNIINSLCGLATGQISIILEPSDRYQVVWQDGLITFNRINLRTGTYSFTITDLLGECEDSYTVILPEEPFPYVHSVETEAETCLSEGEIYLNFSHFGHTYQITAYRDGEFINQFDFSGMTLKAGNYLNIRSGNYTFVINISGGDDHCIYEIKTVVEFKDLDIKADDDWIIVDYNSTGGGNILSNDTGTGLKVFSYGQPAFGTVSVEQDGDALYIPMLNFNGIDSFIYAIRDTCGQLDTATVRISVQEKCEFEGIIITKDADCGLSNGTASIIITPDTASYEIIWSNGQTGWSTINLNPGNYFVTVQDLKSECKMSFPFEINGEEANILRHYLTEAASCYESGNISLFFNDEYPPPYQIEIWLNGEYIDQFILSEDADLKEFINVRSGEYEIVLTSSINQCAETITIPVDEKETKFQLENDTIKIKLNHEWNGNILDNDTGTGLKVIEYIQPDGGSVDIDENGETVFKPKVDFEGITEFHYIARDTCGQTDTAYVIIEVYNHCKYETKITGKDAVCGLNNGAAEITILPDTIPFNILWSNGQTERKIDDLEAGVYYVTITTDDGCELTDSIDISEKALELITSINSTPADCVGGGNIFGVFNPSYTGPYIISLFASDTLIGVFEFTGNTFNFEGIHDFKRGQYIITVHSKTFHPECSQTLNINIMQIPSVSILIPDYYTTANNIILTGNVLTNDTGHNLMLQSISPPVYGNIIYQPNGNFTFTPYNGFTGIDTMIYHTTDICGHQAASQLIINVTAPEGPGTENKKGSSTLFISTPALSNNGISDIGSTGFQSDSWALLYTSKQFGVRIDFYPFYLTHNTNLGALYNFSFGYFRKSKQNWYLLPGISVETNLFSQYGNSATFDFRGVHSHAGIMLKVIDGLHIDIGTTLQTDFRSWNLYPSIRLLNEFRLNR